MHNTENGNSPGGEFLKKQNNRKRNVSTLQFRKEFWVNIKPRLPSVLYKQHCPTCCDRLFEHPLYQPTLSQQCWVMLRQHVVFVCTRHWTRGSGIKSWSRGFHTLSCHSAVVEPTSRSLWSAHLQFYALPISYLLLTARNSKWNI